MSVPDTALCPFCNHVLDIEMFNSTYGCDTGCDYVRFEVECPGCGRTIYETGSFGEFDREDEAQYREDFMCEWLAAVVEINAKRQPS